MKKREREDNLTYVKYVENDKLKKMGAETKI